MAKGPVSKTGGAMHLLGSNPSASAIIPWKNGIFLFLLEKICYNNYRK